MLTTCLRGLAFLLRVSESGFEPRNQRGCGHTMVEEPKAHTTPGMALGVCGGKQGTQRYRAQCVGSPSYLVQRGCEDEALWGSERWLPASSARQEELPARGKVLPASSGAVSGSAAVKLSHCPRLQEAENSGQLFTGAGEDALAPRPSLPGLPQPLCSLHVPFWGLCSCSVSLSQQGTWQWWAGLKRFLPSASPEGMDLLPGRFSLLLLPEGGGAAEGDPAGLEQS